MALYGEAIAIAGDGAPATYFSNRSVAWAALSAWQHSRDDAEQAMQRPNGITTKTLFHKARAQLKLEDINAAEQTMALAARCGLHKEVEELLNARGLSIPVPETSTRTTTTMDIPAPQLEEAPAFSKKWVCNHEKLQAIISRDFSYLVMMGLARWLACIYIYTYVYSKTPLREHFFQFLCLEVSAQRDRHDDRGIEGEGGIR